MCLQYKSFENTLGRGENAGDYWCLAPLAIGQRAYVIARWLSRVRLFVHVLSFSLNIVFSETTYQILIKIHRNVPAMVLFRISWKNLIPYKNLVAMATKPNYFLNLWKSSCQKPLGLELPYLACSFT